VRAICKRLSEAILIVCLQEKNKKISSTFLTLCAWSEKVDQKDWNKVKRVTLTQKNNTEEEEEEEEGGEKSS